MKSLHLSLLAAGVLLLTACDAMPRTIPAAEAAAVPADDYLVRDSTVPATLQVSGTAHAIAQATLSTKLMGSVRSVLVHEGDRVTAGQILARIDARDVDARRDQARAAIASAEAAQGEAALHAKRWRALFADSAAPRAQVDAADAALARANAALETARAGHAELTALGDYAVVRAPFSGMVTRRFVDPGAFAAPGTPLISMQDDTRLRVTAAIRPVDAQLVRRGMSLEASVEGMPASATVEGVFPSGRGSELYTINAVLPNVGAKLPSGGAALLTLRIGTREAVLVPLRAIKREGSLTGVAVIQNGKASLRWVRLGPSVGNSIEILAGLRAGDSVRVPHAEVR